VVTESLFWPLVYWTRPREYDELFAGESIHDGVFGSLDLDGRAVCDIGAGSGRFTILAARRARSVVAIDIVAPLLEILQNKAHEERLGNVEVRRGAFRCLPLDDASVDFAVACSAFTTCGPHGGDAALAESERVVRTGGQVAVIWPSEPEWFEARGYSYVSFTANAHHTFRDVDRAAYLCGRYYSAEAEAWVREHNTAEVPYAVLGVKPPNDMCIKRIER
jgi:ubiquinone/menaquinone biosynthesis C-methylase UbiE